jgi:hypothetical protein
VQPPENRVEGQLIDESALQRLPQGVAHVADAPGEKLLLLIDQKDR